MRNFGARQVIQPEMIAASNGLVVELAIVTMLREVTKLDPKWSTVRLVVEAAPEARDSIYLPGTLVATITGTVDDGRPTL